MKSLESALKVLKSFIDAEGDQSVNDVVLRLGLTKSHASKILGTLRDAGMIEQNPQTRRYSVGVDAFELGTRFIVRSQVARDALPIMRQLVETCGHSATLSILREKHVLHIMAVEGPHYVDGRWRVGNRLPAHATSAGQVLVAWMSAPQREAFLNTLELTPITEHTITSRNEFNSVLADIRRTGCSITRGASAPGLAAMAVPVFDEAGRVGHALGLVLPEPLFDVAEIGPLRDRLFEAARTLSLKLGASDFPFAQETS